MAAALALLANSALKGDAPRNEDWLEAARYVQASFAEGDVIRIEPYWMTGGRVFFGDLDGGPRKPFRILDLHREIDAPYLYHYTRLWLVAALDARDEAVALAPPAGGDAASGDGAGQSGGERAGSDGRAVPGAVLLERKDFERVSVFLFSLPSGMIVWEAPAEPGAGSRPPGSVGLRQVAGGPRRCLVLRPEKGKAAVEWRATGDGILLVRAGNTIEAARAKEGGDVDLVVGVQGEELDTVRIEARDYTLHEIRTGLPEGTASTTVRLEVKSAEPKKREVCVDAYLLDRSFASREAGK